MAMKTLVKVLVPVVVASSLLVPVAAFAAGPGTGTTAASVQVCRTARITAVASALGLTVDQLKADVQSGQKIQALAQAKGISAQTLRQDVKSALTAQGVSCRGIWQLRGLKAAIFIRSAAKAMNMTPWQLTQAIFQGGFPAVLTSKGLTADQVISQMTQIIVNWGTARGKNPNPTQVKERLTNIYDHLMGIANPDPNAPVNPGSGT